MTVRRSGTETGTLKTRMGTLIRDQGANIGSELGLGTHHRRPGERTITTGGHGYEGNWLQRASDGPRRMGPGLRRDDGGESWALRHALQKRLFRGGDRVGGSDMHPDAVEAQAEQAFLLVGAVEHFCQREFA